MSLEDLFLMRQLKFRVQKKRKGEINDMTAFGSVRSAAKAGILCSDRTRGPHIRLPSCSKMNINSALS
jgi:hypothetical protein